jgi:CDP-diacylglycerol--serine O-phosphatidyltransferase
MKRSNLKFLVPNGITFLSLTFGVSAILAAADENLILSGAFIFTSYWLDSFDGFFARKLNAASEFGLQLDSLVDVVSLGVAPAVLVFQHMRMGGIVLGWAAPLAIFAALAGAFRLARFNQLPPKTTSRNDSVGLPITQSGGTLALAVLADTVYAGDFLPIWAYLPMLAILGLLMVSTIPFPSYAWFFSGYKLGVPILVVLLLSLVILPTFSTWFLLYVAYLLISLGRALTIKLKSGKADD